MSIEELKREAERLSFDEQGQLAAYLVQLRNQQDPGYEEAIRERVADGERSHWLTPDEFEARLDGKK